MKKILRWLDINFEPVFGMVFFFFMLGIILYQIFARAITGNGVPWGEEVCKMCYVWVSYIGFSFATRNSIHIEIDAVRRLLPEKVQKCLMIFTQIVMLYLFFRFFMGTLNNTTNALTRNQRMLTFDWNTAWMLVAGPIGYGLGVIRCFQTLYWKIRHFNCSMPVFVNPNGVLNGGLGNVFFDEEIRAEYREQVPEEAYSEVAEFNAKHGRKSKEG